MAVNPADIELQKAYFRSKLAAERQTNDVVKKVKGGKLDGKVDYDFVLVDTRDRASYEKEHIPGAICIPPEAVEAALPKLDRGKEYVTYCWHAT